MLFSKDFAQEFKATAERIPAGLAKDKQMRNAARLEIMSKTAREWHEILLPGDLDETAFESSNFFQSIHALNLDNQQKLQRGIQFLSNWDGYPCVLIGGWANQCFSDTILNLPPRMVYVMPFKFDRFLQFLQSPENISKGINVVVSRDGRSFTIESHGCTVYDGNSNPIMEDVMATATYLRLFNQKVLVSPEERLWRIS